MSSDTDEVREWIRAKLNEGLDAAAIIKQVEDAAKGPAAPSSAQHLPKSSSPKVSPSAQNNEFRFFGQRLDPRIDPVGAIIFKTVSEASAKRQHARKTASDLHSHSTSISTQEKNEAQPPVRIARQTFPRFSKTPLSAKVGGGNGEQTVSTPVVEDNEDVEPSEETPSLRRSKRRAVTKEQHGTNKKQKN